MIDINATATELGPKCMQLLAVHTLTGCDTVNFPYDKGKCSAVSTLLNHQTELDMMGEEEAKMLSVIAKAHKFTLLFYKENRPLCFMNEYRYLMFSKNKDSNIIETLPAIDPASKHKVGTLTDHALEISWSNTPPCGQFEGFGLTCRGRWSAKTIPWQ